MKQTSVGRKARGLIILVPVVLAFALLYQCGREPPGRKEELGLSSVLSGAAVEGFSRARDIREFQFPADHGAHPAYRTEWWYFTGNLRTPSGRRFGYELALFRFALNPDPVQRASQWASNQVYMGHLAVTDTQKGVFHFGERMARESLDLAGATRDPIRVWVEDWSVASSEGEHEPWQLRAAAENMAVSLDLVAAKPVVLQGDRGLSRKSDEEGNASYYYSIPRLETAGTLSVDREVFEVTGLSWIDREWSTSALSEDQAGWDWFSVQLSNGYDLMFYQLRRKDGRSDRHSAGVLIDARGHPRRLRRDDVSIEVRDQWESPRGGVYPGRWRILVHPENLDLSVVPVLADQELDLSFRYWEGAVDVTGRHGEVPVTGEGYVELTGYGSQSR